MSPAIAALGILIGLVAGVGAGLFGVGGGIVTTPAIQILLGGTAIEAVATPLPVIFPTALVGVLTYRRAGEVSFRAAAWAVGPGTVGAVGGAALTGLVNPHALLVVTAALIGLTAAQVARGKAYAIRARGSTPGWQYAIAGFAAGFVSGMLGVGGGIILVPVLTTLLGMPLKRALGTSLAIIAALVIPGTIVHAALGHIDWPIFVVLTLGVIPGARMGAKLALGARERSLRIAVGVSLGAVAVLYGAREIAALVRG
ncbi:MAG: sulfite exporter TauE/SafE family protein [Actinomycetota bacterium]